MYGKVYHLLMKLEYRAYRAIKKFNFDMQQAGSKRRLQLAKLKEMHNDTCENAKNSKQIMRKSFVLAHKVFLFNSHLHLFPNKLCSR